MTIIDLGEVRDDARPEPPRRPPRTVGRPTRVALVLALALVALAGAGPQGRSEVLTVPTRPGSAAYFAGDRLLVTEPVDAVAGRSGQLSAYAVPPSGGGRLRPLWRVSLPSSGVHGGLVVRAALVFVVTRSPEDGPYRTSAFDLATGERRWERPGAGIEAGDGLLLVGEDGEDSGSVRFVEPATGRTRWTVPAAARATTYRFRPDGADRIVLTPSDGPAEIWDARTGVRLRSAAINPGDLPVAQGAQAIDDLLLVVRDNASRITGYGLDGLERRWEIRLGLISYFADCGVVICAYGQTGGMWGLDPATGAVRWTTPRWRASVERGGRLLVSVPVSGSQETYAVLETATGRLVGELGHWDLAGWYPPDGRLVGLRPTDDGRLVVADLDVGAARARVRDVLPGVSGDCQADAERLLCRRTDGSYGVWWLHR